MPTIPIMPIAYEGIPNIDRSRIPADQTEAFLHIVTLLAELGLYERHFLLAVYLYEYSRDAAAEITDFVKLEWSLWTTGGWQMIAGRDGAMTIYHFASAIEGLQASLKDCPALTAQVEHREIRNARGIFDGAFPGYARMRHTIAHVADFSQTLTKKKSHSVKGQFKKSWFSSEDEKGLTWLRGNMNDDTYAVTYNGEVFTYDLNRQSAAKSRSIKQRVYSAFDAALEIPKSKE